MRFRNPANGYVEEFPDKEWLMVLIGGPFYFLIKGMWLHVAIAGVSAMVTAGFSWIIYPFFTKQIIRAHYLRKGWTEMGDGAEIVGPTGTATSDVVIQEGGSPQDYKVLGEVEIRIERDFHWSKFATQQELTQRLQERAVMLGANRVINVTYDKKEYSLGTNGYVQAKGLAVLDESDFMDCPYCAERIKSKAKKCKHCGSEITPA